MTNLTQLLRNTGFGLLANLMNRVANALFFILVSRFLGSAEAGAFNLATSYFFIGSRIAFWGLDHLLTRDVAKRREHAGKYFINFALLRAVLAMIVVGAITTITQFLPYTPETKVVILLVACSILPENISNICQSLFMAFEEMRYLSIVALIGVITKLALGAFLLWQDGRLTVLALVYAGTAYLMMFANLIIVFTRFIKPAWSFDWGFCRQQMRVAVPFIFVGVFFILDNQLDVVLISFLGTEQMIGFYGASMTIISAIMLLPEGYRTALFPMMARFQSKSTSAVTRLYEKSFKYLLLMALPITLGLILTSEEIIALIFKSEFAPAGAALRIMAFALGFFFLNMLNSRLLIVYNRQSLIARALLINTLVTIILDIILIPFLGVLGAAISKSFTAGLLFIQYSLAIRPYLHGISRWRYFIRPFCATALLIVSVLMVKPYGLLAEIAVGAIVYLAALGIMGTFTADELDMCRSVLVKRNKAT